MKVVDGRELMGRNEYARHRGERSPNAVTKAEQSGRISKAVIRDAAGELIGIDWRLADELWAQNTDALEAARSGKFPSQMPPAPAAAGAEAGALGAVDKTGDKTSVDNQGDFLAARVKESTLRGELLELEKLEKVGELLPRAIVRKEFTEIFAQLKNAALRIPDRKSQVLAGETDPTRVQRVLSDEIRNVFDEFSRQLLAPTAGLADDAGVDREREATVP